MAILRSHAGELHSELKVPLNTFYITYCFMEPTNHEGVLYIVVMKKIPFHHILKK